MAPIDLIPPINFPNFPNFGSGPVTDALAKDEKVKLSELLRRNGWGGKDSSLNRQARAIIQCESSNDTNAVNKTECAPGENAVGLMQICTVHRGTRGIPKDKDDAVAYLKNPDKNVKIGRALYREHGWQPWACKVPGNVASQPDPDINIRRQGIKDAVEDVTDPLFAPIDAMADFFRFIVQPSSWLRIGKVTFGLLLLSAAVIALLVTGSKRMAKSPTVQAVSSFVPAGRAAKLAKAAT